MTTMSTLATPPTATTSWKINPVHSVAEFKVKHMMISNVKGQFARVRGVLTLDEAGLTHSRVAASIEAASLNTRDAQRDTPLKSEDFLHAERFPTLTFRSTRITPAGSGELAVAGDLTIRGVTRDVVHRRGADPARDPWGTARLGLSTTTKASSKEFGLTWNAALETGGILVGDDLARWFSS
jgi:polyisoprenoid-binding protein YceI